MRSRLLVAVALVLALPAALFAAPTAILVDTSRSIPAAQFERAKGALAELAPALTAKGPVAVYAFNDGAVKVVDFTEDPSAVAAAIGGLSQGGRYTLLYDCLFAAVRDMEARKSEGAVLLLTDGKDENSAVTLEDAAGRADAAHVAVVTAGLGTADDKVLRRIAALTGGRYAGGNAGDGAALRSAWSETAAALVPVAPPPAPPEPAPVAQPEPPSPPPPSLLSRLMPFLLFLLALLVLVVAVGVVVLLRRTRKPDERACEICGRTLNVWETECPHCLAQTLSITRPGVESQSQAAQSIPELDPALLQKGPLSESLENTLVLDEVPILTLKRGANPPRVFQLPLDQVVSVGRDKTNTISVADQTLSAQHFRIVPKEGVYYLADLQSTNGTFLNGERVSLRELKPGSVVHAGTCDFTFTKEQRRLN